MVSLYGLLRGGNRKSRMIFSTSIPESSDLEGNFSQVLSVVDALSEFPSLHYVDRGVIMPAVT